MGDVQRLKLLLGEMYKIFAFSCVGLFFSLYCLSCNFNCCLHCHLYIYRYAAKMRIIYCSSHRAFIVAEKMILKKSSVFTTSIALIYVFPSWENLPLAQLEQCYDGTYEKLNKTQQIIIPFIRDLQGQKLPMHIIMLIILEAPTIYAARMNSSTYPDGSIIMLVDDENSFKK